MFIASEDSSKKAKITETTTKNNTKPRKKRRIKNMKIIKNLEHNSNLVLALGFFDGVHLAHQKLLKEAHEIARKNTLKCAVITFKDHPLLYLKGIEVEYLFDNKDNYKYIEETGALQSATKNLFSSMMLPIPI